MGRPKLLPNESTTRRSVLMSDDAWRALQFIALRRGTNASELARTAIAALVYSEAQSDPLVKSFLLALGAPLGERDSASDPSPVIA